MSYCLYLVLMHAQVLAHCGTVDNPDNGPDSEPEQLSYGCSFLGSERRPDRGPDTVPDYGCPFGADHVLAGPGGHRSDDPYCYARSVAA